MSSSDIGQYYFVFSIDPPSNLSKLKLPVDIKIEYNENNLATKMEIGVYGDIEETKNEAIQKVKKLVAILSLQGIDLRIKYQNLYRLLPNGGKAYQRVFVEIIGYSDSIIDNTAKPIIDITQSLSISDIKFWRQMGHYDRGTHSLDAIERYREFYQVLEDEGAVTTTEKALRHAVNHPMLTSPATVVEVTRVLGSPCFDPMNQKHIDTIQNYADELQEKAKGILLAKI